MWYRRLQQQSGIEAGSTRSAQFIPVPHRHKGARHRRRSVVPFAGEAASEGGLPEALRAVDNPEDPQAPGGAPPPALTATDVPAATALQAPPASAMPRAMPPLPAPASGSAPVDNAPVPPAGLPGPLPSSPTVTSTGDLEANDEAAAPPAEVPGALPPGLRAKDNPDAESGGLGGTDYGALPRKKPEDRGPRTGLPPLHDRCHCRIEKGADGKKVWIADEAACEECLAARDAFNAAQTA